MQISERARQADRGALAERDDRRLQGELERILEALADAAEELGGVRAVEDPWSQASVRRMMLRTASSPSWTTGVGPMAPTARIAAWGGLMTAVKLWIPNMPRFDTVKVPEESSGGVIAPARTRSASARVSLAIWPSDFLSASNTVGTTSASWPATATPTFTRP